MCPSWIVSSRRITGLLLVSHRPLGVQERTQGRQLATRIGLRLLQAPLRQLRLRVGIAESHATASLFAANTAGAERRAPAVKLGTADCQTLVTSMLSRGVCK